MFHYDIKPERRRVDVAIEGDTDGKELRAGIETVIREPLFDASYAVLIDMRRVAKTPSIVELRDLALAIRTYATSPGARRAIVTDNAVFYHVAALFTQLTMPALSRYRVFRNLVAAEAWLDHRGTGDLPVVPG